MAVALITGGSRGIGAATARRLARDGHDVAIAYRSEGAAAEGVAQEVRDLGRRATVHAADLERPEEVVGLVLDVQRELGAVGVLVANAGINQPMQQDPAEVTPAEWDRAMAINLRAPFLLAREVIGSMMQVRYGRIVLVSSVAAFTGGIIGPHYAASKAALHGLAHSLSQFAAGSGVTVNVVAPALIATDMLPQDGPGREQLVEKVPVGRLGEPDEVADLIAALVANGYITNQSILIDGGMHPL
jgi:3-oxoacyl-[acyl-carrier protein] reductase